VTTTGDVIENPVTGERGVVRLGTVETAGARAVVDLYVRFEAMILNLFGLAQDGKTNARGLPSLLQLALLAREFRDVIRFTRPPQVVQAVLFGMLAPLARLLGYQGSYPEYLTRRSATGVPLEP